MSDPSSKTPDHEGVDPARRAPNPQFDRADGFFGQGYSRDREAADGAGHPSGHPLIGDPAASGSPADRREDRDIPPENGRRASFDPATGEVHGSGSGVGEDFDTATSGGAADAPTPDRSTP